MRCYRSPVSDVGTDSDTNHGADHFRRWQPGPHGIAPTSQSPLYGLQRMQTMARLRTKAMAVCAGPDMGHGIGADWPASLGRSRDAGEPKAATRIGRRSV